MGKVYTCVGRYAGVPYTIKKTCMRVYCVEELCFYVCNNAYFLEDDFFTPDLLLWLEEECDLLALARKLRTTARQSTHLESMVRALLETTHYCSEEEIAETEKVLMANRQMSGYQKLKLRGDFFLKNNRYAMAMQSYEELIALSEQNDDIPLMASAYHNQGVIYAKMFLFDNAAKCFRKAYELDQKEHHMTAYLATLRIRMSDDAYLKKIGQIPQAYETTAVLETRLEQILAQWKESDEFVKIKGIRHLREEGSMREFYRAIEQQTGTMKEEYREQMMQ